MGAIISGLLKRIKVGNSGLLKDLAVYVAGALFLKGAGFLLIPLYTRSFSPEVFGNLEYITTFLLLIGILVGFGFPQLVYVKYLHLEENERRGFIGQINFTYLFISAPVFLLLCSVFFYFDNEILHNTSKILPIAAVLFPIAAFFQNSISSILQLERRATDLTINRCIAGILILILNVILITKFEWGIESVFFSTLVSSIVSLGIFYYRFPTKGLFVIATPDRNVVKSTLSLIKEGWPFIITSAAYFGIIGVDKILVRSILGSEQLGLYSLGFKFASLYEPLIIAPILSAFNPYIFSKFKAEHFRLDYGKIIFISLIFFPASSVLIKWISQMLVDERYTVSSTYIIPLSIGYCFFFLSQLFAAPLLYFQRKLLLITNVVLAGVSNVILNTFLILWFGIDGAIWAFVGANCCWLIVTIYQSNRVLSSQSVNKSRGT